MLEQNRISIYFVNDCVLVIQTVMIFTLLIFCLVKKDFKKDKAGKYNFFSYIIVFILVFRFIFADNYPNVPRQEIGCFYKIPEGQTITYPKYPRGIASDN
jgi:cytochrome bd-type quinol oxidase subunit 2